MKATKTQTHLNKTELLVKTVQSLSMAQDLDGIIRIVRSVARRITGADGATFVLRDGDLCYYVDEEAISPLWKGSRFPMDKCISGWVMLNKKSVSIPDIYLDDRIPAKAYRPTFVKSLVMVPIRKLDPIGAIGNYWSEIRTPTEEEITLLQALADITSVSIENIEIKNKLKGKLKERTKMLDQLQNQKFQLEEFTQIIAHNMRAPLSNLTLLSELISETEDVETKLEYIDLQSPVIEVLNQTLEEIIDSIHVKMGFDVESDHINLNECFQKTCVLLQGEIMTANAEVVADFENGDTAYFPKKYMESIFFNLLSNAIKYCASDRKPKIKVTSYKKNGWLYLDFKDNGLGMDLEKHRDKLFGLRKTFHEHPDAKGFGLFITKAQVEAMDGAISVESTPNKGTTFTVKLNKTV